MNEHVSELSAHATPIEVTDSGVPDRILIAPWGWVESRAGSFLVDTEAARTTLDAFEEAGVDVPVDYEHQTLGGAFASPSGQAPAAGWIQRLEVVEGQGILAQVSWTPLARERLARREYRYLSPVAIVRTRDQRLVGLHSAALTNKPAIVEMQPIVNRQHSQEPEERTVMNEPLNALRELVTLDASVGVDEVLVAAKEHIVMLHEQLAQRDAEERVLRAIEAGKLTEAQREWAVALALKDPQAFEAWQATAPVVVITGRTEPPDDPTAGDAGRRAVVSNARQEYRQHPALELLTSEEAYVSDALRQAGFALAESR